MDAPVLEFQNVEIRYGGVPVVRDVSFGVSAGEVACVVGESGSGKSTLLRAAMGLLGAGGEVSGGSILLDDQPLADLSERELRRRCGDDLAMVFQDSLSSFVPVRRIGDQVWEGLRAHGDVSREDVELRACELFGQLGLGDARRVLASYPFELSGGMGQRVGIAAALLSEPRVLLADEPTSALDAVARTQVVELLRVARRELGCAIVLVTHDMRVARALADYVLVLRRGLVVEQGLAHEVLDAPRETYTQELLRAAPRLLLSSEEGT